jgi:hypothetical protein
MTCNKLFASRTTVALGKVTVVKDHPLAKAGCVAIADFEGSTLYGFGPTCSEALDDLVIRHRIQIHEAED